MLRVLPLLLVAAPAFAGDVPVSLSNSAPCWNPVHIAPLHRDANLVTHLWVQTNLGLPRPAIFQSGMGLPSVPDFRNSKPQPLDWEQMAAGPKPWKLLMMLPTPPLFPQSNPNVVAVPGWSK